MTTEVDLFAATPENCKRLREEGMAWNKIGEALGLHPGDSVADMKKRGSMARKLYAEGGEAHTPSRVRSAPKADGEEATPKAPRERKKKAASGRSSRRAGSGVPLRVAEGTVAEHLLRTRTDEGDEAVLELLRGKTIKWIIRMDPNGGMMKPQDEDLNDQHVTEMAARVGPRTASIVESFSGNPTVCFNEPEYGSRAVYLAAITEVLG